MQITRITKDEYREVENNALAAMELLEDERFKFLRDNWKNALEYAKDSVLNNTVREVSEVVPVSEKITRIFKTPKKVQVDELIGQYKLVTKWFEDLKQYKQNKIELDEAIARKQVIVE